MRSRHVIQMMMFAHNPCWQLKSSNSFGFDRRRLNNYSAIPAPCYISQNDMILFGGLGS